MSIQMRGAEVAKAMKEKLIREREELNASGVNPCLTIIRVGAGIKDRATIVFPILKTVASSFISPFISIFQSDFKFFLISSKLQTVSLKSINPFITLFFSIAPP